MFFSPSLWDATFLSHAQIADHQEYNEKGDVYSFSLIMWEMLAGEKPFMGETRARTTLWVVSALLIALAFVF